MSITGAFIMPHPPLILPQIGQGEELKIQKTINSCREIAKYVAKIQPDTIVLTSPHKAMSFDYFNISYGNKAKGNLAQFNASEIEINLEYDTKFAEALNQYAKLAGIPTLFLSEKSLSLDHGAIIPLTFINEQCKNYKLVCVSLSDFSLKEHYRLGMCIADVAKKSGKNVVFIASGDLSHKVSINGPYGFAKEGIEFDSIVTTAMARGDFLKFLTFNPEFIKKAAECGLRSFTIMAGSLDGTSIEPKLLSYESPFGVGYAVASFIPKGKDDDRQFLKKYFQINDGTLTLSNSTNEYISLAKYAVEHYVNTGELASCPKNLSKELLYNKAGVFVSIKKNGELRGCIGTIEPVTNCVAEEIIRNAVSASSQDYRFHPIQPNELDELKYSVDVLTPTESISSSTELDVKRYGVIVTSGNKRGLLLPDLEGVNTATQQISIAMQKAGISQSEPYTLERFEVTRYK